MEHYSKSELEDAICALSSLISKCDKAKQKLVSGTAQHTLLIRRIKAFKMANSVFENMLKCGCFTE